MSSFYDAFEELASTIDTFATSKGFSFFRSYSSKPRPDMRTNKIICINLANANPGTKVAGNFIGFMKSSGEECYGSYYNLKITLKIFTPTSSGIDSVFSMCSELQECLSRSSGNGILFEIGEAMYSQSDDCIVTTACIQFNPLVIYTVEQ